MSADAPQLSLASLPSPTCDHARQFEDDAGNCVVCHLGREHDRERSAEADLTGDGDGEVTYR